MKEYGSNVQKLADHIKGIQDKEKRTLYAHILVELMRQVHPNMKDNQDYSNKLWDDLYIMSGFELDVNSPFPPPSKELLGKKPLKVAYNQHGLEYRHYGRNLELLVEKAINTESKEDRLAFVSYLFRLMRSFYNTWNKDNPDNAVLLEQLEKLSKGKLHEELEYIRESGPVEASPRDRSGNERGKGALTGYQAQTNPSNERDRYNTNGPDRYNSYANVSTNRYKPHKFNRNNRNNRKKGN